MTSGLMIRVMTFLSVLSGRGRPRGANIVQHDVNSGWPDHRKRHTGELKNEIY